MTCVLLIVGTVYSEFGKYPVAGLVVLTIQDLCIAGSIPYSAELGCQLLRVGNDDASCVILIVNLWLYVLSS